MPEIMDIFFRLESSEVPWGDYGTVLAHGIVDSFDPSHSDLHLSRAGPYIPPISFPWSQVVVTDSVREAIPASFAIEFAPVSLKKIVDIPWHLWDRSADEPARYPAGGEPENYIAKREHSKEIASVMPKLWRLVPEIIPNIQINGSELNVNLWTGASIFRSHPVFSHIYCSSRLADWLREHYGEYVMLTRVLHVAQA